MPVRGNGAPGGGSVVHYHKDNLLYACVLCRVMKRNPAAVSYHCTIGNMKSRQEAEPKLRAWVADDFVFGLIYAFFVPLHLKPRLLHAATTLFAI